MLEIQKDIQCLYRVLVYVPTQLASTVYASPFSHSHSSLLHTDPAITMSP